MDKQGLDATEFREFTEHGQLVREPVMTEDHRWGMIADLYRAGWSYRLIAQLADTSGEEIRRVLSLPAR
jgi:hypothetical protein